MSLADRREMLRLALGASLLPVLASQRALASAPVADAAGGAAISPPECMMTYRRRVLRELPGGARLTVERDFQVTFAPGLEGGFVLSGQQVRAAVEAPPALAAMARLEEQRVERGIFPLALDRAGQILLGEARTLDSNVVAAMAAMRQHLALGGPEAQTMLAAMPADGHLMTAELPPDLFAPLLPEVERREIVALPWGESGEVLVHFTATRDPATKLMRAASRQVTTRLAGQQRRTAESWELFPA